MKYAAKRMDPGWTKITLVAVSVALGCAAFADGADVIIDSAGTRSFEGGSSHGRLLNAAGSGEVVLSVADESTSPVAFTAFDATVASAQTVFRGGIWDFASSIETNFFDGVTALSNRKTTIENGAVVKNVNWLVMGGVNGGTDNELTVQGASKLQVANMTLGYWKGGSQKSICQVKGGSELTCSGMLSLTEATTWYQLVGRLTGNELHVSGAGTKLTVGGETSLGRNLGNYNGALGGNLLSITDGAEANLKTLSVGRAMRHGESNVVHIAGNARVTMTDILINSEYSDEPRWRAGNLVEILDGAVVTNTGILQIGGYGAANRWQSHTGNRFVVSNATFHTAKVWASNTVKYLLPAPEAELVVSGANAVFTLGENPYQLFWGAGSTITVENGAKYTLPIARYANYDTCANCTVRARSGATLTLPDSFQVGGKDGSFGNALEVSDGAMIQSVTDCALNSENGRIVVDNATLSAGWGFDVGKSNVAANCQMTVRGKAPVVRNGSTNLRFLNQAKLSLELPADGYAEGYATFANPVISAHNAVIFDVGCVLELKGVEALLQCLGERKEKGSYVLLQSKSLAFADGNLGALRAALPEGVTLEEVSQGGYVNLVLTVKPPRGMAIIIR